MSDFNDVQSVLKLLDHSKANKAWFDDRELEAGYHSVELNGQKYKGQRDAEQRLEKLGLDFAGKVVLDMGCSNGGLLHRIAPEIELGVGVDYNPKSINAANAVKAAEGMDNVHFYVHDLDRDELGLLPHFLLGRSVDVCFFLSVALWIENWQSVFRHCASISDVLVFESHGNEIQQQKQLTFIQSQYKHVEVRAEASDDDPTYVKRKLYLCTGWLGKETPEGIVEQVEASKSFQLFQSHSEDAVREAYEQAFPEETATEIEFHPNTHESIVAEINGAYIVKFPRPSRGMDGILGEKAITDLLRERVDVAIPNMDIRTAPVALARYPKLAGEMLNRKKLASLSDAHKQRIADSLAAFLHTLHSIPAETLSTAQIAGNPSWFIDCDQIEEFLIGANDHVIRNLAPEVVKNHRALKVPRENRVFGHFDLHGSNVLVDKAHQQVTGVIDFGNCKVGDIHQELSTMNLSSPDMANRIINAYEVLSGWQVNRVLVDHYTTVFYLNLLAGMRRRRELQHYDYWLARLHDWYDTMLARRARKRLESRPAVSSMHPQWREWLASQLLAGVERRVIQAVLREQGYSDLDIAAELLAAAEHPFLKAGQGVAHLLKKRNWLLEVADQLGRLDPHYATTIETRSAPDFDTFVRDYYSKMRPVVLKGGIDHWPALGKWTPDYLREQIGNAEVEIQCGREGDPDYERNARKHKKSVLMKDFVDRVLAGGATNDYYMTAGNTRKSYESIQCLFDDVGDFHQGYRQPDSIHTHNLLWFGPKGTYTPLHHDLTNNMLVQLYGRKKVTVYPPFQVPFLYNEKGVFSEVDVRAVDQSLYPLFDKAQAMEVILEPGDAIFLPIACWHVVESLDVAISITFTDFNGRNEYYSGFPR